MTRYSPSGQDWIRLDSDFFLTVNYSLRDYINERVHQREKILVSENAKKMDCLCKPLIPFFIVTYSYDLSVSLSKIRELLMYTQAGQTLIVTANFIQWRYIEV